MMSPERAFKLGVDPAEVQITTEAGKYQNNWIVWIPDSRQGKIILTESRDIFAMCRWKAQLRRMTDDIQT